MLELQGAGTMSKLEAAKLLNACKPLCYKLVQKGVDQGISYELDKEDLAPLMGYQRVYKAGLGYNEQVRQQAGLKAEDIALLNFVLACERWRLKDFIQG
jgi:hypothetical protein